MCDNPFVISPHAEPLTHDTHFQEAVLVVRQGLPQGFTCRELHLLFTFASGFKGAQLVTQHPPPPCCCTRSHDAHAAPSGHFPYAEASSQAAHHDSQARPLNVPEPCVALARFDSRWTALNALTLLSGRILHGSSVQMVLSVIDNDLLPPNARDSPCDFPSPIGHSPLNSSVRVIDSVFPPPFLLSDLKLQGYGDNCQAERADEYGSPPFSERAANDDCKGQTKFASDADGQFGTLFGRSGPWSARGFDESVNNQQRSEREYSALCENPPCNTLYVGNLPPRTNEEELRVLFSPLPGYKRMSFQPKHSGPMCFVEFEDVESATVCMNALYGTILSASVKGGIRLSYSKNPLGVRQRAPSDAKRRSGRSLRPGYRPFEREHTLYGTMACPVPYGAGHGQMLPESDHEFMDTPVSQVPIAWGENNYQLHYSTSR